MAKVSIIIPTYNRASTLGRAIDSVVAQDFQDWELIIVDDGSTDNTSKVLEKYRCDLRIRSLCIKNQGVSHARNLGIKLTAGEWVAFLDSDDEWLPQKLSSQLEFAKENPDLPLIHGDEIWIRNGVRVNPMKKHEKRGGDIYKDALKLCCISPSTVMLKRKLFDQVGLFREDFPVCEDYDLWLKITSRFEVGYVDEFLIKKYGGHEDQLSRKFVAMDYWRIVAMNDRLKSGPLTVSQSFHTKQEIKKKSRVLLKGYRKHENLENFQKIFDCNLEDQ